MTTIEDVIAALRERAGAGLIEVARVAGQDTVVVNRDAARPLLEHARRDPRLAFDFLVDVTAVDYLNQGRPGRFGVVYHLASTSAGLRIRIRAMVPEEDPKIPSVADLWPAANWGEREAFDMYGVEFTGHPNLVRILMPDDYDGFPLRKDYPLKGRGYRDSFRRIPRSNNL